MTTQAEHEASSQWYLIEKPTEFRYVAASMFARDTLMEKMESAVEQACSAWDKPGKFWLLTATPVQFHVVRSYTAKIQPRI